MANPRTIARLEARILERAAYCLQFELSDPRASFITITRVKLSSDVTTGRIYYSVLGDASDKSKAQHMLDHAAGFIQRQVSRVLELRRMPRLSFFYDDSAEQADNVARLIKEARERDMQINPALRDEPPVAPAKDPARAQAAEAGGGETELGADEEPLDDEPGDGPSDDEERDDGPRDPSAR